MPDDEKVVHVYHHSGCWEEIKSGCGSLIGLAFIVLVLAALFGSCGE